MELSKEQMKMLVESYEGHIKEDTSYRECVPETHECPIHRFFMDMKKEIEKETCPVCGKIM